MPPAAGRRDSASRGRQPQPARAGADAHGHRIHTASDRKAAPLIVLSELVMGGGGGVRRRRPTRGGAGGARGGWRRTSRARACGAYRTASSSATSRRWSRSWRTPPPSPCRRRTPTTCCPGWSPSTTTGTRSTILRPFLGEISAKEIETREMYRWFTGGSAICFSTISVCASKPMLHGKERARGCPRTARLNFQEGANFLGHLEEVPLERLENADLRPLLGQSV